MTWLKNLFHPVPAKTLMEQQLYEADRQHVEHLASAEHHKALADMYAQRAIRLRASLKSQQWSNTQ